MPLPSTRTDQVESLHTAVADRYELGREIGRGGMATVYLANDLRHGRRVAIKVLHSDLGHSLGGERFLREIRIVAQLAHPHILPLFDSGEANGQLYFVMPFIEGESLRARLMQQRRLSIPESLTIAQEVLGALDYAHRKGFVHRDIKPENILLADGHAMVADFGVARAITASKESAITATGLAVGTPAYMSPEQAFAADDIDGRSDLYSLATVLYEMLTGTPPFTGGSAQGIIMRRVTEDPTRVSLLRPELSADTASALMRALAREPADRPATAADMAAALTRTTTTPATVPRTSRVPEHGTAQRARNLGPLVSHMCNRWLQVNVFDASVREAQRSQPGRKE